MGVAGLVVLEEEVGLAGSRRVGAKEEEGGGLLR
jgi:hypothetical protein